MKLVVTSCHLREDENKKHLKSNPGGQTEIYLQR